MQYNYRAFDGVISPFVPHVRSYEFFIYHAGYTKPSRIIFYKLLSFLFREKKKYYPFGLSIPIYLSDFHFEKLSK